MLFAGGDVQPDAAPPASAPAPAEVLSAAATTVTSIPAPIVASTTPPWQPWNCAATQSNIRPSAQSSLASPWPPHCCVVGGGGLFRAPRQRPPFSERRQPPLLERRRPPLSEQRQPPLSGAFLTEAALPAHLLAASMSCPRCALDRGWSVWGALVRG
jgi:hypothetical protein